VTVAGHSQGSGHAAYLAKLFAVGRVILIGGPQDNFDPEIAGWVTQAGPTPAGRYYSLVHRKDFFGADLQISVFKALIGGDEEIFSRNAIVSEKPVGDAHMELIQPKFSSEWRRLLGTP
jgi:pimeloyl-ACP methyl ester carboxylesterase